MNPELVLPSEEYKESFLEAVAEQPAGEGPRLEGEKYAHFQGNFEVFLNYQKEEREGKTMFADWVPQTVFWLVENGRFIGRASVRHFLNDHLLLMGGHIGYAIRPSERNKGYGSLALKLALEKARDLGIQKALVTCNEDNVASRKIIEKNGGIFENKKIGTDGMVKLRFWVPTS